MSGNQDEGPESKITTDQEIIRGWASDHGTTPVRHADAETESGRLRIVPESELSGEHERLDWEAFFQAFGEGG